MNVQVLVAGLQQHASFYPGNNSRKVVIVRSHNTLFVLTPMLPSYNLELFLARPSRGFIRAFGGIELAIPLPIQVLATTDHGLHHPRRLPPELEESHSGLIALSLHDLDTIFSLEALAVLVEFMYDLARSLIASENLSEVSWKHLSASSTQPLVLIKIGCRVGPIEWSFTVDGGWLSYEDPSTFGSMFFVAYCSLGEIQLPYIYPHGQLSPLYCPGKTSLLV